LPAEVVVSDVPHDQLLVVGLLEVGLPVLFTTVVYFVVRALLWQFLARARQWLSELSGVLVQLALVLAFVVIVIGQTRSHRFLSTPWDTNHWMYAAIAGLLGLIIGCGTFLAITDRDDRGKLLAHVEALDVCAAIAIAVAQIAFWIYNGATAPCW